MQLNFVGDGEFPALTRFFCQHVILSLGGGVFDQLPRKNHETIRDKLPPYDGDIVLPSTLLTRTKAPGCYILPSC